MFRFLRIPLCLMLLSPLSRAADTSAMTPFNRVKETALLRGVATLLPALSDMRTVGAQNPDQEWMRLWSLAEPARAAGELIKRDVAPVIAEPVSRLHVTDLADRLIALHDNLKMEFGGNYVWKQGDQDLSKRYGEFRQTYLDIIGQFQKLAVELAGSLPVSFAEPPPLSEKLQQRRLLIGNFAVLESARALFSLLGEYKNYEHVNEERAFAEYYTLASQVHDAGEIIKTLQFSDPSLESSIHDYSEDVRHLLLQADRKIAAGINSNTSQESWNRDILNLKQQCVRLANRIKPYVQVIGLSVVEISYSYDEIVRMIADNPAILQNEARLLFDDLQKKKFAAEGELRSIEEKRLNADTAVRNSDEHLESTTKTLVETRAEMAALRADADRDRAHADQRLIEMKKEGELLATMTTSFQSTVNLLENTMRSLSATNTYGSTLVTVPAISTDLSGSLENKPNFIILRNNMRPYIESELLKLREEFTGPINQTLARHGVTGNDYNIELTAIVKDVKAATLWNRNSYLVAMDIATIVSAPGFRKIENFSLPVARFAVDRQGQIKSEQLETLLRQVLFRHMQDAEFWQRLETSGRQELLAQAEAHCDALLKAVRNAVSVVNPPKRADLPTTGGAPSSVELTAH